MTSKAGSGKILSWVSLVAGIGFIILALFVALGAHEQYRRGRESNHWPHAASTVRATEVKKHARSSGGGGAAGRGGGSSVKTRSVDWRVHVTFRYEVDGRSYEQMKIARYARDEADARDFASKHPVGSDFGPVYYDPEDPNRFVTEKGGEMVFVAFMHVGSLVFLAIGILMVLLYRMSALGDSDLALKKRIGLPAVALAGLELLAIVAFELTSK